MPSKNFKGQNNTMFNKNIYDVWVEKLGKDIADKKYEEWIQNIRFSVSNTYRDGEEIKKKISNKMKGRVFSDNHRKNLRLSQIKYLEKKLQLSGNKLVPSFNINACKLF